MKPTPYYDQDGITIYCGDCRDILPHIEPESIDVVFMDPPYGHGNHQNDLNARLNEHRGIEDAPIVNDTPEAMRSVLAAVLRDCARILKQDCCCCCCCCCGGGGPRPTFAWVAAQMDSGGLQFFHSVIWDKLNPGLGWRYRRQHEMVMVAHRAGGKLRWADDGRAVPNIYQCMPPRERLHPNEKPLELVTSFLAWHALQGDTILDPFIGSGTTLVAAKLRGLKAVGIEINEDYCKIAVERLRQRILIAV